MNEKIKNINLKILLSGLLLALFFYYFLPAVQGWFNLVNPTFNIENIDFYAYYIAGRSFISGADPYTSNLFHQVFIYPPTFLPAYAQLARQDYQTARHLWMMVYLLFFSLAVFLFLKRVRPQNRSKVFFIIGLIFLVSFPLQYLIRQGQVDLIVGSISFCSLLLYLDKKHNWSALCLAAATLIKMNPLFLMITFFLFFRDWKYLLRYLAALGSFFLVSLIFIPFDWYRIYFTSILPSMSVGNDYHLQQTLARFFPGSSTKTRLLTILGNGGFAILAVFLGGKLKNQVKFIRSGQINPQTEMFALAFFFANCIVTLITSASAWIMTYTWFILPSAWAVWLAYKHISPWLTSLLVVSVIMIHGHLAFFNELNLTGACICLVCLLLILFLPQTFHPDEPQQVSDKVKLEDATNY